ncbi:alginate lyase family protein [Gelidibacter salicanalis]|uniref:Alginate lyase family protein n=1 Tax=Gelidibacter salicanalis TaxID=291193 RepID=A0A934KPA1_9FLAO|nr:alginate lyase family protein [Gelidibacter salicanalis]MBJ7882982.1 alginate lyase family protein [Gelidibacter salicanalis]
MSTRILKQNTIYLLFLISFCTITAQNTALNLFDKLDYQQSELKTIESLTASNSKNAALKELLKIYRAKENLYLQVDKDDVAFIKSTYPKDVATTIEVADQVLDKYFLFRYDWDMEKTNIPHQFKGEIDWKAIPNGDEEWCYMLNRHRYWVDLGKAYMLTGKEKYAKGFVDQATHWIDNNPIKEELKRLSWRRIEAGIRIENWIKAFEFIKHSKHVTPEFLAKYLNSLHEHATYINSDFNNFSKTSNWGVLEFQGVFNASQFLTEFKDAQKWQDDALANLTTCIDLQILPDGTQWEQSPMYHNEVFHCYMNVNLLAQQKGIELPETIVQKTKDMAYANVEWQKPNFHQPLLGDSDDTDLRGILTLAAHLFSDPTLKSRAFPELDYETFFLLGSQNAANYKNLKSKTPEFLSVFQESSGDVYMRTSWEQDATYSSFHMKRLGGGHGHDNLLHFSIFANNRDYLVDSGRYSYVDNDWRELFKGNKSHNTLGVDDLPNSMYKDSWMNTFEARSEGIYTNLTTDFDYAEAENTAYQRLEDPVAIKRRLLFLKPNVWLVFDSFSTHGEHKFSQYFNFPNEQIEVADDGITTTYPENNLRIQPIKELDIKLSDAWYSPEYNLKKESKSAELYKNAFST